MLARISATVRLIVAVEVPPVLLAVIV